MENQKKVMTSVLWKGLDSTGAAAVQFIIQIILSRILTPEDFGISSITSLFIYLLNVLLQNSFTKFLVQRENVDDEVYSTTFYASLVVSLVMGAIVFLIAPFVGVFYASIELTTMVRVISALSIVSAYNSVQTALVARNFLFKEQFIATFASVIISGILAIFMARNGFGVWAIVIQQVFTVLLISIFLGLYLRWLPKLSFSKKVFKQLFSFGGPLFVTNLWEWFFSNLRPLIIGRQYNTAILGYYNRGNQFPVMANNIITTAIQSVLLPVFSKQQSDKVVIKHMAQQLFKMTSVAVFPIMIGMALVSRPVIILLLTERWVSAVPIMQIMCVAYALVTINILQLEVMYSIGEVNILLKMQYLRMIFGVIIIILTIRFGIIVFTFGYLIEIAISVSLNFILLKNHLNYSIREQLVDLGSNLVALLLMVLSVVLVSQVYRAALINMLLLQIIVGVSAYSAITLLVNRETVLIISNIVKRDEGKDNA